MQFFAGHFRSKKAKDDPRKLFLEGLKSITINIVTGISGNKFDGFPLERIFETVPDRTFFYLWIINIGDQQVNADGFSCFERNWIRFRISKVLNIFTILDNSKIIKKEIKRRK